MSNAKLGSYGSWFLGMVYPIGCARILGEIYESRTLRIFTPSVHTKRNTYTVTCLAEQETTHLLLSQGQVQSFGSCQIAITTQSSYLPLP